jgi:hypothetical protein
MRQVAEQDGAGQLQARFMHTMTLSEMLASERVDGHRATDIGRKCQSHHMLPSRSSSDNSEDQANTAGGQSHGASHHHRGESLHVNYATEDVKRMATEILDGTIAPVHLSLLGYWICEKPAHYEIAKTYIRELALDQVRTKLAIYMMFTRLTTCPRVIMWRGSRIITCASSLPMSSTSVQRKCRVLSYLTALNFQFQLIKRDYLPSIARFNILPRLLTLLPGKHYPRQLVR